MVNRSFDGRMCKHQSSSIVIVSIPKASEESVVQPQLQILLRCQRAALLPALFNV